MSDDADTMCMNVCIRMNMLYAMYASEYVL